MGVGVSDSILSLLENATNTERINSYFKFNLLKDEDDNKFVDCAIGANADFILTQDSDFKILETIDFPKVRIINIENFKQILDEYSTH